MRRALLVALTLTATAAAAAPAAATTYCVGSPPGCSGTAKATIQAALTAAAGSAANDTVIVGTGTFTGPFTYAPAGDAGTMTLEGQGDGTILTAPAANGATVLAVMQDPSASAATVEGLFIRVPSSTNVTGLDTDGLAESVTVMRKTPTADGTYAAGVMLEGHGHLDRSTVVLNDNPTDHIIQRGVIDHGSAPATRVTDSGVNADVAISAAGLMTVRRAYLAGGADAVCGAISMDNSLLVGAADVESDSGCGGRPAELTLDQTTMVGRPPAPLAFTISGTQGHEAQVWLRSSIVSGFGQTAVMGSSGAGGFSVLDAARSLVDLAAVSVVPGSLQTYVTDEGGVVSGDPRFTDTYALRAGSPAIDAGTDDALDPVSESTTDLAGGARILDGDGDGTPRRDMGAFEYTGPYAHASAPATADTRASVAFDAGGSGSPQGRPVSYAWTFDDGASAAGVSATHAFATPGAHSATLTVTDNQGLSATRVVTVAVVDLAPSVATPVIVTASSPPPVVRRCIVPSLKGLSETKARAALKAAQCALGRLTHRTTSSKKRQGHVLSQAPAAGPTLDADAAVDVTIGKKPKAKKKHRR